MNPTYMNSHYIYIEDIFHPRHNLQELNEILLLLLLLQNPHTLLYRGHKSTSLHFFSYIWGKNPHCYCLGQRAQAASGIQQFQHK